MGTKNKRFNKGISLSTGCAIFKTAWELPENNGLILPSRIIRHFKQVLPKKPKKDKKKKKAVADTNVTLSPVPANNSKHLPKSRTMMEIRVPTNIQMLAQEILSGSKDTPHSNDTYNSNHTSPYDEQSFDENSNTLMAKINNSRSQSTILDLSEMDTTMSPSINDTNIRFRNNDDLKLDVEDIHEQIKRSVTDIQHMDVDLISFKKDDPTAEITKKKKKKKKKQQQILYAEDATKLFKKINDGKRFKNGISLNKACNIFYVAWELPEENGRILPSKVVRHFKQVLPSKKSIKKKQVKVKKVEKRTSDTTKNIKPSLIKIIKTESMEQENASMLIKPQTMRGHLNVNGFGKHSARRTIDMMSNNAMSDLEKLIADTDDDDHAMKAMKRRKAGSMNHLELSGLNLGIDKDQIVENEVEQIIEEKKKKKQKEKDVANAIDSALEI